MFMFYADNAFTVARMPLTSIGVLPLFKEYLDAIDDCVAEAIPLDSVVCFIALLVYLVEVATFPSGTDISNLPFE